MNCYLIGISLPGDTIRRFVLETSKSSVILKNHILCFENNMHMHSSKA